MDWRRVVGGVGRAFISAGVLILLFVAYQLWGTGVAEARSQRELKQAFEQLAAEPPAAAQPAPGATGAPAPAPPPRPTGDAVAILRIPRIGVEKAVVQGVRLGDLKKGPGHYPETPMPGEPGNAAIAGHRTTYGAPFHDLDQLRPGDPVLVTTLRGEFRYEVRETKVVGPDEVEVLRPSSDSRLTLTTCHPRYSAAQRLVVVAALVGPGAPVAPPAQPAPAPTPAPAPEAQREEAPAAPPAGLSGQRASAAPALWWGVLAAAVWLVTALAARRRRWLAYALGTPVFLVVLFVFFENFSRLLPANF